MTKRYIYKGGGTSRIVYPDAPRMSMQDFAKVYRDIMLAGEAYEHCRIETREAETDGREFTRVYWYHPEDGSLPVLTMWDMNESQPNRIINPDMRTPP